MQIFTSTNQCYKGLLAAWVSLGLACRGDVDDRVLTEAMLPVLHRLADVKDVRPLLRHRFNMPKYASPLPLTFAHAY